MARAATAILATVVVRADALGHAVTRAAGAAVAPR